LGCTHYPLLKKLIQKVVGEVIILVDSAEQVTLEIEHILSKSNLENKTNPRSKREFYLTDVSDTFVSIAANFLGEQINDIKHIDITTD
jgi:glutamate racemase